MRTENWCGHEIRFVELNGEWWAILKDICDAFGLKSKDVSRRLQPNMITRIPIELSKDDSNDVRSSKVYSLRKNVNAECSKRDCVIKLLLMLNIPKTMLKYLCY